MNSKMIHRQEVLPAHVYRFFNKIACTSGKVNQSEIDLICRDPEKRAYRFISNVSCNSKNEDGFKTGPILNDAFISSLQYHFDISLYFGKECKMPLSLIFFYHSPCQRNKNMAHNNFLTLRYKMILCKVTNASRLRHPSADSRNRCVAMFARPVCVS